MNPKKSNVQHLVGTVAMSSKKSSLQVRSVIEYAEGRFANIVGWVTIKNNVEGSGPSILQDAISLRSLSYALRSLLKHGQSDYGDFKDPTLAGSEGEKKRLTLFLKDATYFVNISEGGRSYAFPFDKYALLAFADQLKMLCEENDRMLFWHQRELASVARQHAH